MARRRLDELFSGSYKIPMRPTIDESVSAQNKTPLRPVLHEHVNELRRRRTRRLWGPCDYCGSSLHGPASCNKRDDIGAPPAPASTAPVRVIPPGVTGAQLYNLGTPEEVSRGQLWCSPDNIWCRVRYVRDGIASLSRERARGGFVHLQVRTDTLVSEWRYVGMARRRKVSPWPGSDLDG